MDSQWACGMPVGAFMWISHCKSVAKQITCTFNDMLMRAASFVPDSTRSSIQSNDKPRKNVRQGKLISDSETAMIADLYTFGPRGRWALLPLRTLEVSCVPAAILQRMNASLAAARATRWRQWFGALDEAQQKSHVQNLSEIGNDTCWARLWLECEEWSKPGQTWLVAAAVRAVAILDLLVERLLMKVEEEALRERKKRDEERNRNKEGFKLADEKSGSLPVAHAGPSSAPLTPHEIKTLNLRRAPCYFRLPAHAFRFATQIFSGKSYEDAVKEQKANFNSWVREANVCRVIGRPESVVWDDIVVPKNQVWEFEYQEEEERRKKKPRNGKQHGKQRC